MPKLSLGELCQDEKGTFVRITQERGTLIQCCGTLCNGSRLLSIPEAQYLSVRSLLRVDQLSSFLRDRYSSFCQFISRISLLRQDIRLQTATTERAGQTLVSTYEGGKELLIVLPDANCLDFFRQSHGPSVVGLTRPQGSAFLQVKPFIC
jgi:hypothetical protein